MYTPGVSVRSGTDRVDGFLGRKPGLDVGRLRAAAVVVAASLAFYVGIAHGSHGANTDDGQAMHGMAICLVLLALAAAVSAPPAPAARRAFAALPGAMPLARGCRQIGDARSRASPIWLGRFLN